MAAENVFQEDVEYLVGARDTVVKLEDMQDDVEELKNQAKKSKRLIAQEEKAINDEINSTLKKRKDQIEASFDKRIEVNNSKIKQIQAKKDKKKNQRMEQRIDSETAELRDTNRKLKNEINTKYKQSHVPKFCSTDFFFIMFSPKGLDEFIKLLILLVVFLAGIPSAVVFILSKTAFAAGNHKIAYIVIFAAIIIFEFIVYFICFNLTKVKYRDRIRSGRKIRDNIKANEKSIKAIRNSIAKDKDESVYKLDKYDDKIDQLYQIGDGISQEKQDALDVFDQKTTQIITDEINNRRLSKLEQMKSDYDKLDKQISSADDDIANLEFTITNKYVTYLGKDFCNEERLSDLIAIMEEGSADTVSEAIKFYKGTDK